MGVKVSRAEQITLTLEFLQQNYEFRTNELSKKLEYRPLVPGVVSPFITLSDAHELSIIRHAETELPDTVSSVPTKVKNYLHSSDIPEYDPIKDYFDSLPAWDGKDRITDLFNRIPGIKDQQLEWLKIWLRNAVVHWLGIDNGLHANECVPTFIGDQGCGKSTFAQRLLPSSLRCYYLDHLHLANKNDKEVALTNNLLINLDELDQYKAPQQAELKQALSKVKVNGRPIYGRVQEDRKRYASFIATTNNPHPLLDATGSRRYIIIRIPKGEMVDNDTEIDYEQLYAQVKAEIEGGSLPTFFTNNEVKAIETYNLQFQAETDLNSILESIYRLPEDKEIVKATPVKDIAKHILEQFPNLTKDSALHYHIGVRLKELGFEKKKTNSGTSYSVVLR